MLSMSSQKKSAGAGSMDPEAYAGFLRLLLTPASRVPSLTSDVEAYLRYANRREPVTSIGSRGRREAA
jgi:hypothetical protein